MYVRVVLVFRPLHGWLVWLSPASYPQVRALRQRVGLRLAAAGSAAVVARPRWSARWIDIRATTEHHRSTMTLGPVGIAYIMGTGVVIGLKLATLATVER